MECNKLEEEIYRGGLEFGYCYSRTAIIKDTTKPDVASDLSFTLRFYQGAIHAVCYWSGRNKVNTARI